MTTEPHQEPWDVRRGAAPHEDRRTLLYRYFRGGHELSGGQWQRLTVARGL